MKAVMKLVNGPTVDQAINNPSNAITKMVAEINDDRELIRRLYQRILCRDPGEQEIKDGIEFALAMPGRNHQKNMKQLADYEKQLPAQQAVWEKTLLQETNWQVLIPQDFKSDAGATFEKGNDQVKDLELGARISRTIKTNDEWKDQPAQIEISRKDLVQYIQKFLHS